MSSINKNSFCDSGATVSRKKQEEEAKLWHHKPPAYTKLLLTMVHWENGGLWHCQTLAPNLLGRCRTTGEWISGMQYSHNYPWDKPAQPPGWIDPAPPKEKLNNKQGTCSRGGGVLQRIGEGQGSELWVTFEWMKPGKVDVQQAAAQDKREVVKQQNSAWTFSKEAWKSRWPTSH
jgi:hypothetical protein